MAHFRTLIGIFRWPNLLMMAAALLLTRYCIFLPLYSEQGIALQMDTFQFILLILATVLIGAGGYIVNDILDAGLDVMNKPGMNVIGTELKENQAWNLYYTLNAIGIILGALLSYFAGKPELGILFLLIATALYYYSLKYKYLPFWGNFVVSLLTAMTVMIVWLFEFFFLKQSPGDFITISPDFKTINIFVFGFAFLAFFVSFIREIAKDAQDKEGDQRYGCRTIPVVLGELKTRWLLVALYLVSILFITSAQVYFAQRYLFMVLVLSIASLLAVYSIFLLIHQSHPNYMLLSKITKVMLATGLLSMIFLWYPF